MSATSPRDYEAYIRRNETWNFVVNMLDLTFFHLGTSFIFGSTVLSLYASHLTSSATLIGLIPAIQSVGYFLPQLLLARQTERLPRKKPLVQWIGSLERLPYLFVALSILLWPNAPASVSFIILALGLALATGSGGVASPPWTNMLAKVIRVERRGSMFGLSRAIGGLLGMGGAAISSRVLDTYPRPTSFGICFLFCFVSMAVSWICLSLNREPAKTPRKVALAARDYWRHLPGVLRGNPNFAKYLASRAIIVLGTMGIPFYIVYGRHAFQMTDAFAGNLTMAALVGQTVGTPLLGWLADRRGHKWLTELSTLIGGCSLVLVLLAPSPAWFYAIFALMNISVSGMSVAGMSMTMEFCDTDDLPTFAALANSLLGVPLLLAPLLGGWLADVSGYPALFAVALVFTGMGWASFHWAVRDPRYEQPAPSQP
ncbi:MAG: MFS transporter [Anaerolineales bacterium]|nr:MAG: MFS transporter [Anaerolineales bacterium]